MTALKLASMPICRIACCPYISMVPERPVSYSELSPADHTLGLMNGIATMIAATKLGRCVPTARHHAAAYAYMVGLVTTPA